MPGKLRSHWLVGGILRTVQRFAEKVASAFRKPAPAQEIALPQEYIPAVEPAPVLEFTPAEEASLPLTPIFAPIAPLTEDLEPETFMTKPETPTTKPETKVPAPEAEAAPPVAETKSEISETVAFVADPFGISTQEIAEAQADGDGDVLNSPDNLDDDLDDEDEEEHEAAASSEEEEEHVAEAAPEATEVDTNTEESVEAEAIKADAAEPAAPEADLPPATENEPLDTERLARLSDAIAAESKSDEWSETTTIESTPTDEERAAQELAAQIAEDQALAAEDAKAQAEAEAQQMEETGPSPLLNAEGELDLAEVQSCIEALLFMSDKPLSAARLRELLGPEFGEEIFAAGIQTVLERYQAPSHGIELVAIANGYQFRTKSGRADLARKLVKTQIQRLSTGAMETLAIVAYKQPVLKDDIDKIRGVDSSYFIRGLLDRKLIEISGRSDLPGRPMVYGTTDQFLELFSLNDVSALPPLHELERMIPNSESGSAEDPAYEDPRVRQMRKLVAEMNSDDSTNLTYNPEEDAKILSEIRERVQAIPTSTPYLDEQKALEKQHAVEAAAAAQAKAAAETEPELPPTQS